MRWLFYVTKGKVISYGKLTGVNMGRWVRVGLNFTVTSWWLRECCCYVTNGLLKCFVEG